jgi:hypothetical protein
MSRQCRDEEHARSHEHLRKFHEANPAFKHPDVHALGHHLMTAAQREDLERAGLINHDIFREVAGRDLEDDDVHNLHLRARADGHRGVRGHKELVEHCAQEIERRIPSLKRRAQVAAARSMK